MKEKYGFVGLLLALILVMSTIIIHISDRQEQESIGSKEELSIVTSFYPMYIAALNVTKGMEHVKVTNMTGPNAGCLHDYQLKPEDMIALSKADIFIINGGGIESFMDDVMEQFPNLTVIDASAGIDLLENNLYVENHFHKEDTNTGESEESVHSHIEESGESVHSHTEESEESAHNHIEESEESEHNHIEKSEEPGHNHTEKSEESAHNHTEESEESAHSHTEESEESAHSHTEESEESVHSHIEESDESEHNHIEESEESEHNHIEESEESTHSHIEESIESEHYHSEGEHHDHNHGEYNAHVWMDISKYKQEIANIAAGIEVLDSSNKKGYEENVQSYTAKLDALDQKAKDVMAGLKGEHVIIFHDAFVYFAEAYGLEVDYVIDMDENTSLSANQVATIVDEVRAHQIKVLFCEKQYSTLISDSIAKETGASVYTLDSLVSGDNSYDSYIRGMEYNLELIKEALK
jgi:zinc transport system substrate-binding protein